MSSGQPGYPAEDLRHRAWAVADRLAKACGQEVRVAEIPGGYRVSVRLYGDGIDDREVLDTLAAGDRFGHSGSHRPQGDSRDKGAVWCEVYLEPPPRPGVVRPETVRTGCHGNWPE